MSDNTITVRFFARLREELETEQLVIEARPGLTAGDVLADLFSPEISMLSPNMPRYGPAAPGPAPLRRLPAWSGTAAICRGSRGFTWSTIRG